MASSVLVDLARDSILEVLQAKRRIDKTALLDAYPLLAKNVGVTVEILLEDDRRSFHADSGTLLENNVLAAKKAAFPKNTPLKTSEFFDTRMRLTLHTDSGTLEEEVKLYELKEGVTFL